MEILWTIVLIIVGIAIAPFVALGSAIIIGGVIVGVLLFFGVTLVGPEPSTAVFVTCIIAGTILTAVSLFATRSAPGNTQGKDS